MVAEPSNWDDLMITLSEQAAHIEKLEALVSEGAETVREGVGLVHDLRARIQTLEDALRGLVEQTERLGESSEFRSVFLLAKVHGMEYAGPTVEAELAEAQRVLAREVDGG